MIAPASVARLAVGLCGSPVRRHRSLVALRTRVRRALFRARLAVLRRRRPGAEIVVIALVEHLGDLVAAAPLARAVRAGRGDVAVVWIARPCWRELVAAFPGVDRVWTVDCLTEWSKLAGTLGADRELDLHLAGRYCPTCAAPHRPRAAATGIDVDNYYRHGALLDVFARLAGVAVDDPAPRLAIPSAAHRAVDALGLPDRFVAVHATSNQRERDWDAVGWERLARALTTDGVPVVEVGGRAAVADRVAGVVDLCGRTTVLETAEVLRRATLFVGVDSGPAHLADATRTPAVLLLGRYRGFVGHRPWSGAYADPAVATVLRAEGPAAALPAAAVIDAVRARLAVGRTVAGLVTVVIPAYGHAAFVRESVESALGQQGPAVEVIVVDDGSPDDTAAVLAPLRDAGRIRYLRQPNAGTAAARNTGLRAARGEFVAFLDDDDAWPPGTAAALRDALVADPGAVLAYGRHADFDGSDRGADPRELPSGAVAAAFRLHHRMLSPGQALLRTAAVRAVGGFDPAVAGSDDWDLAVRLAERGRFVAVERVTLRYRRHAANASRRAVDHAAAHWRAVAKLLGDDRALRRRHARAAAAYFVPNLIGAVRRAEAAADWRSARSALWMALRFEPSLALRPWFLRACGRALVGARRRARGAVATAGRAVR